MANDDDILCRYIKCRAKEAEASKLDNLQKNELKADVALAFEDTKKTKVAVLLFKNVCVSKSILDTKWKAGSKNYAVNFDAVEESNGMKWFAFKDYSAREDSWKFVHESVLRSWAPEFEKLNVQKVLLVPLSFVNECAMSFEDLFKHYKKEIEKE